MGKHVDSHQRHYLEIKISKEIEFPFMELRVYIER